MSNLLYSIIRQVKMLLSISARAEAPYQIKFRAATNDLADKVTVHYYVDEGGGMTLTGTG